MKIDFVIPWVDGSDKEWTKLRNSYSRKFEESRYREWDVFHYWFRAVEKYAPWVNKIHLITCGQVPEWLNTEHPKLNLVFHEHYMPERYLPTFSSHPIELNMHRIEGLSEHFVYFNDDTYLCSPCKEEDFFKNGLPCDSAVLDQLFPSVVGHQFIHILSNNLSVVNAHFQKKTVIKKDLPKWFNLKYGKSLLLNMYLSLRGGFTGFKNFHLPQSFRKCDFEELWEMEPELLEETSSHRFREYTDINQYAVRMLNLCKGEFCPRNPKKAGQYFEISRHNDEIADYMQNHKGKMICINDVDSTQMDFERDYQFIHSLFEELFPEKSSFEL